MTRLLLDTHVLIWWLEGGERLSRSAAEAIASPDSVVCVSPASLWEASIKHAKGRLEKPPDLARWVRNEGFEELPIRLEHGESAGALPPHHADPFDRILIAQAQLEGLTIVTRDPVFEAYGIPLLAA